MCFTSQLFFHVNILKKLILDSHNILQKKLIEYDSLRKIVRKNDNIVFLEIFDMIFI
jgi:hypothetical protein